MLQTLDLPVLSLDIPNIQKLNTINADDLSCMWTVFSKCKDSLENGRRLENMSWRLWYRESSLKESERTAASTCPIPIQQSKNEADKHLSSTSFKRIISSLNENKIIAQPTKSCLNNENQTLIQFEKPTPSASTSTSAPVPAASSSALAPSTAPALNPIKKVNSSINNPQKAQPTIKTCHSAMNVTSAARVSQSSGQNASTIKTNNAQPTNTPNKHQVVKKPQEERSKFFIKEEEEQGWSSDDEDEDATPKNSIDFVETNVEINNDADHDEIAFLSEFRKRSPPPISTIAKRSILSNMLQNETNTRLAHPNLVAQRYQQHEQLSTSLRACLRRERQPLYYGFSHDPSIKSCSDGLENTFYGYW
ncbi:uncharacterized protein EV154DRAFT_62809 [Mucor mucedo]|uniref:uncharacterized protein n=1 Tax=Mucor mucedo TaxID=29922 RepID=UPI00221F63E0|nr:uncharacterized protein EV154DRAFT_62809 [Mucor mucedo]KAI7877082.1 hypothetical protein EV154DRAFT_62809 [Mucor mucedo]